MTDAVIVGQLCGIALMIARFSESAHKEIIVAANRLRQNGVNLRGSILNAVEASLRLLRVRWLLRV